MPPRAPLPFVPHLSTCPQSPTPERDRTHSNPTQPNPAQPNPIANPAQSPTLTPTARQAQAEEALLNASVLESPLCSAVLLEVSANRCRAAGRLRRASFRLVQVRGVFVRFHAFGDIPGTWYAVTRTFENITHPLYGKDEILRPD